MTMYTSQTRVLVVRTNFVDPDRLPAENRQDQTMPKVLVTTEVQDGGCLGHFECERRERTEVKRQWAETSEVQENLDQKV